jgi:hypothetical protein
MGALMSATHCKQWPGDLFRKQLANLWLLLALLPGLSGQSTPQVSIGQVVDAVYVDRYWQERRLAELRNAPAVVLYFATVECPMVARTLPKLGQLAALGRQRGVEVLVVNVGPGDSFLEAVGQATLLVPDARFAWDRPQALAAACGVRRTNTAVVLNAEGRLWYRGRVDSSGYAGPGTAVPSNDLETAVEQVLRGSAPEPAETSVAGCLLTPPAVANTGPAPTYFQHIVPLVDRACVLCHLEAENSGIRLALPADLERHANMLGEVVDNGRMPPWFAAKADVPYANQRILTEADRATVQAWLAAGKPRGEEIQVQRHPQHVGWQSGEVDRILTMEGAVEVPASGRSEYSYVVLPERFAEDTWIAGLEVRTQVPRAWRHCNVAIVSGESYEPARCVFNVVSHAASWRAWPGTALRIPAGHRLALQVYHEPTGVACRDHLIVGLRFPRWEVRRELQAATFGCEEFCVAAEERAVRVESEWIATVEGEGCGVFVHMHGRGRDVRLVHRQDKVERALLWVPIFSFGMQSTYWWPRSEVRWSAGASFRAVGHFDNSAENPSNPDPTAIAKVGPLVEDEQFWVSLLWLPQRETLQVKVDLQTGIARSGD